MIMKIESNLFIDVLSQHDYLCRLADTLTLVYNSTIGWKRFHFFHCHHCWDMELIIHQQVATVVASSVLAFRITWCERSEPSHMEIMWTVWPWKLPSAISLVKSLARDDYQLAKYQQAPAASGPCQRFPKLTKTCSHFSKTLLTCATSKLVV